MSEHPTPPPLPGPWGNAAPAPPSTPSGPLQFPCENCGGLLTFAPGADSLKCQYCGHENPIPESDETIAELDFRTALAVLDGEDQTITIETVQCGNCAAEFTLDRGVHADECPFCGSQIVTAPQAHEVLKPRSLLPFRIDAREARKRFAKWVSSRWFAPNKLKAYARSEGRFTGMYVPYWTYDSQTTSRYHGQRGTNYTVTRTVTVNGKPQTRTETRIRWRPVSGTVSRSFDDVLVLADDKLPRRYTENLEPWDLENLVPYDERYLSGFRAETYAINLRDGFTHAEAIMDRQIRQDVRRDIGGDHQRITSLATRHENVTYKPLLLPVWLAAYRFRGKVFNIVVNGRTGEVQGERPYSWIKIMAAVLGALAVAGALYFGYMAVADSAPLPGAPIEVSL